VSPEYQRLYDLATTDTQREVVQARASGMSWPELALTLKRDMRNCQRAMQLLKLEAARQDATLHSKQNETPEGFAIQRTTTLYKQGEEVMQWVRRSADDEKREQLMREAIAALSDELPRYEPAPAPTPIHNDLLNLYILTDYHLGMRSWHEESGENWDIEIAEHVLMKWIDRAIATAPDAECGVFAQLGDFLHWDGLEPVTPAHKHVLDVDTRFPLLVRTAIRAMRYVIDKLLRKHNRVHVIVADANHDPASGAWLREWIAAVYEQDTRLTVDTSADTFYCYEWGRTSLFFHHGHRTNKPMSVDNVFASRFRDVFGRTEHSYAHLGHRHHSESKETNLMLIEQHRTLAAKDAYASSRGYEAGRDAKVITYSKDHGEVGRVIITPEMIR
jgi:hypothetical protein